MASLRTIIDTDPGIDDAMAILLAASDERISLVGLTIVHGNLGSNQMFQLVRNGQRVLRLLGLQHVPVVAGSDRPLVRDAHSGAPFVHGEDGMGNVALLEYETEHAMDNEKQHAETAAEFLVRQSREEGVLHVIALGPLTNIALAQRLDPTFGSRVKLYAMGGAFLVPGNVSTNAEANIWNDPEAANEIFSTFSSVQLAPLDVTCSIKWGADFLALLKARAPVLGSFIAKIAEKYIEFHHHALGRPECDFHDSSAVLSLIAPHLFTHQELHWVRVETRDGFCRGVCVADFRNSLENPVDLPKTVNILLKADADRVLKFYADQIAKLDARIFKR